MNSWVLTAVILVILLWCIVRAGPRRAERTLRLLARHTGGRFQSGGIISRNAAIIPRNGREVRVTLRCISWLGIRYAAEFRGPWAGGGPGRGSGGRPDVPLAEPTRLIIPGTREPGGSDQLREVARRLQTSTAIEQEWVWVEAARDGFSSQAVLKAADTVSVADWYETTARLYELMVAETEVGIEFSAAPRETGAGEASCQVCGVPPQPAETVYCEKCGAPHHADCWNYNRGCAIYGCKK